MNADIVYEKRALRLKLRKMYSELGLGYVAESDLEIFNNLKSLPEFLSSKVLFSYFSVGSEPDTHRIIKLALSMGKTVALPRCRGREMVAAVIKSLAELENGAYNIPAPSLSAPVVSPEKIDFAIIPSLAVGKNGYRLGQGGGFYDRYLENKSIFTACIVRSEFVLEEMPYEPHDTKPSCIITEKVIARLI